MATNGGHPWEVGQIVFTKMRGWGWWPAEVLPPKDLDSQPKRKDDVPVIFMGDFKNAWIPAADVMDFDENYEAQNKERVKKGLTRPLYKGAISQGVELSLRRKGIIPKTLWFDKKGDAIEQIFDPPTEEGALLNAFWQIPDPAEGGAEVSTAADALSLLHEMARAPRVTAEKCHSLPHEDPAGWAKRALAASLVGQHAALAKADAKLAWQRSQLRALRGAPPPPSSAFELFTDRHVEETGAHLDSTEVPKP